MDFSPERRQGIHNSAQSLNGVGKVSSSEMAYWEKKKVINSIVLAQKELLINSSEQFKAF